MIVDNETIFSQNIFHIKIEKLGNYLKSNEHKRNLKINHLKRFNNFVLLDYP